MELGFGSGRSSGRGDSMGSMLNRSAGLQFAVALLGVIIVAVSIYASSIEVPAVLSLRLSESRSANLDAALRFERSLTPEQRAIREEMTRTYAEFQTADNAIQQFCVKSGKLPSPGRAACLEKPAENPPGSAISEPKPKAGS